MYYIILSLTAAMTLTCLYLFLQKKYLVILFIYIFGCVFIRTIHYFYNSVNYLGLGKEWSFLDIVFLMILLSFFRIKKISEIYRGRQEVAAMFVILILVVFNFILGFVMPGNQGVLNFARKFLFIPIFFMSLILFKEKINVEKFYDFLYPATVIIFVFHILIAFRFIEIPLPEDLKMMLFSEGVSFLRIELFFSPLIYILSFSVYLCRIIYVKGLYLNNLIVCSISTIGILLTQTRSCYIALAVVLVWASIRVGKFFKISVALILCLSSVLAICTYYDIDLFHRFVGVNRPNQFGGYLDSWRGLEYLELYSELSEYPLTIFLGQGFGASHRALFAPEGVVNFFHNEYLKVISSLGLVGFLCHVFVLARAAFLSRRLVSCADVGLLLTPVMLVSMAALPASLFGGFVWHPGFGPLMMVLLAIIANRWLYVVNIHRQSRWL